MEQQGKVVLISGAAKRIGADIARVFSSRGYRVILHYHRSGAEAQALQLELQSQRHGTSPRTEQCASVQLLQADLNDPQAVSALARDALACFNRLDVLVNNASSFYATPLGSLEEKQWQDLMNTNARAALFLCQSLAPALRETGGSIVNLTDMNADRGMPGFSAYTMAKAALKAMTKSLARELAPEVRVNSVSPGAILWPEHASDPVQHAAEQARILAGIPVARLGSTTDIAEAVFFLANDAHYMTGQTIRVDGGRALC
jgi:pteridine reductase